MQLSLANVAINSSTTRDLSRVRASLKNACKVYPEIYSLEDDKFSIDGDACAPRVPSPAVRFFVSTKDDGKVHMRDPIVLCAILRALQDRRDLIPDGDSIEECAARYSRSGLSIFDVEPREQCRAIRGQCANPLHYTVKVKHEYTVLNKRAEDLCYDIQVAWLIMTAAVTSVSWRREWARTMQGKTTASQIKRVAKIAFANIKVSQQAARGALSLYEQYEEGGAEGVHETVIGRLAFRADAIIAYRRMKKAVFDASLVDDDERTEEDDPKPTPEKLKADDPAYMTPTRKIDIVRHGRIKENAVFVPGQPERHTLRRSVRVEIDADENTHELAMIRAIEELVDVDNAVLAHGMARHRLPWMERDDAARFMREWCCVHRLHKTERRGRETFRASLDA